MAQFSQHVLEDGTCVIEVSGEFDLAVVDEFLEVARGGLSGAPALILDLREVSFIDSTGLGALVLLRNEAGAATKRLRLDNLPRPVTRLLALTGLQDAFEVDGADLA